MPISPLQGIPDSNYRIFYVPSIIFGYLFIRPGTIHAFILDLPFGLQFNPFSGWALFTIFLLSLYSTYLMHNVGRLVFGTRNYRRKNQQIALRHTYGILLDYKPNKLLAVPRNFTNIEDLTRFARGFFSACRQRKSRTLFILIPGVSYSVFKYLSIVPLLIIVKSNSGEYLAGGLLFIILLMTVEDWLSKLIPIDYLEPDDYQSIYLAEYEKIRKLDTKEGSKPRINKNR